MAIEIELKYLVSGDDVVNTINEVLNAEKMEFTLAEKLLINHYFETPGLAFRKNDMGLRVRESDGRFEQTIKTAGKVIGGLHQRPEYNVDIDTNFPELNLFPNEIWQGGQQIEQLQQKVVSIFTTNFERTIWLVTANNGSQIELVFDQGSIEANSQSEEIKEIELELISGQPSDIFAIAQLLFKQLSLRPGIKSKAARGYALWQNTVPSYQLKGESVLLISDNSNADNAFIEGVSQCLQNLQHSVEHYLVTKDLVALVDVTNVLATLRHGFWVYQQQEQQALIKELSYFIKLLSWAEAAVHIGDLKEKALNARAKSSWTEALLAQLEQDLQQFPAFEQVSQLVQSERFNLLQLNLLKLLLNEREVSQQSRQQVENFAIQELDAAFVTLKQALKAEGTLSIEQYVELRPQLHRSLLTGTWLGGLLVSAENNARLEYRSAWYDLQKGLTELQVLWVLDKKIQKLDQPSPKLINWYATKVESLLLAVEHSRQYALEVTPYWKLV